MHAPTSTYPHPVTLTKDCIDGKRPGDTFQRGCEEFRVIQVYRTRQGDSRVVTEHVTYGREVWF